LPIGTAPSGDDAEVSDAFEDSPVVGDASSACPTCTVLATEALNPQSLALDSTNVYWTNAGATPDGGAQAGMGAVEVVAQNATSGGPGTVLVPNLSGPLIIANGAGWLVWSAEGAGMDQGTVSQLSTNASTVTTPGTGLTAAWGVAVDSKNAYWVSSNGGAGTAVQSAPLATGVATVLGIASGDYTPGGLAVNGTDLYFAAWSTSGGGVFTVPIGGGAVETVWLTPSGHPQDVALDATTLYWLDEGAGILYSTSLTGGTVTMLATGFEDAFHLAVDANNVYVADHGAGTILEIPKMGGTSITLASGLDSPLAVAANSSSTSVFFTTATLIESVPKQ
jgi:hypothetical protein